MIKITIRKNSKSNNSVNAKTLRSSLLNYLKIKENIYKTIY